MVRFLIKEINGQISKGLLLLLIIIFSSACRSNLKKLPIDTSFGELISIEIKKHVETDEKKINPKPGEILYLLTFAEGDTIPFNTYAPSRDIRKAFPMILETVRLKAPLIIDLKTKTQYIPVLIGMKDRSQKIIPTIAWGINGEVKNFIWTGTLITIGGMTLVYLIPQEVSKFSIKDHENEFRIK